MILAANNARVIGTVLAVIVSVGFVLYLFGVYRKARPEAGSERVLAANRRGGYSDEELESRVLDRTLGMGLATLAVIAVALPVYWLAEPGRQDGWIQTWDETFVARGETLYDANCSQCHGGAGVGGVAAYTLTDSAGNFVDQVEWKAPALNTVLARYSKEEVTFILNWGRPFSPMPAWGAQGGGAMTTQQIQELVSYLETIQLGEADMRAEVDKALTDGYVNAVVTAEETPDEALADRRAELATEAADGLAAGTYDLDLDGTWTQVELGEAMFNLGEADGFAGGAYSCARCHTKGWSYGLPETSGGGSFGPNLTGGSTLRQFPTFEDHVSFISEGGRQGQAYGNGGLSGAGQMPGFGINPNATDEDSKLVPEQFMYTQQQIEAVVAYERSL